MAKTLSSQIEYFLRDIRCKLMFRKLSQYCRGNVLDVGGWDFFATAKRRGIPHSHWTTLEYDQSHLLELEDEHFTFMHGDGCNMSFPNDTFDTIVNIQVLEHVYEPIKMVEECARVLKPGGYGIFVIPQTAVIHAEPYHYYNFTIFWVRTTMARAGFEIVEELPMGGVWSSTASHMFFLIHYSIVRRLKSPTGSPRNVMFYLLYPLMLIYAFANIPICMFFSLGDLTEEPNNNLIVVRKSPANAT